MTPNGTTTTTPKSTAYYQKGNEEVATETPLITRKLEKRRILTSKSERLVIVLVGLPARGKSFISRKLRNFLLWNGSQCKIFNVGKYRREATEDGKHGDANFFAASNNHAAQLRQQAAELALRDMLRWLDDGDNGTTPTNNDNDDDDAILRNPRMLTRGMSLINEPPEADRVAIFDATNSTDERRSWILNECSNHPTAVGVVFVESICDDEELLRENYQYKIKSSPDFEGMSPDEALEDLRARVKNYEEKYETITDDGQSYIKIFNLSTKLMVNHIYGRMAKTIVPAIMAWNVGTRPIFLCRAGETQNNNAAAATTTTPNNTPTTTTLHDLIPIPPLLDINSPDSTNNDDDAAAAEGWIQQHIMNSTIQQENLCHLGKQHPQGNHHRRSGSNRMTSSKKKNTKLGTKGIKFRDALEDYIEKEGTAFMRKQQTQQTHFDMDTGTSLSGLASYHLPQQQQPETTAGTTTTTTTDAAAAASEESRLDFCDNPTTNHSQAAVDEFPLVILTSTLPRAAETVMFQRHSYPLSTSPNLNPLDKGDYTGLELEEIRQVDPQWFEKLTNDPYFTRFPGGESYSDLITRLEPVIIDMEQQTAPVLLVSHISVLQTLIAYFREDTPTNECMGLEVPLHTVIKFTPSRGGGWVESRHSLLLQSQQQQQQTKGDVSSAASASSTTTLSAHSSSSSLLVMKTTAAEDDTSSPTATMHKSAEKISTPIWGDHLVINNASSSSL
mmetsp:Transcript_22420/g.34030  ORF Transcript_22420/g.34030 Transcript_22420/m.34030 type:complete len:729 (+) Transcript_22420:210-2396(+)